MPGDATSMTVQESQSDFAAHSVSFEFGGEFGGFSGQHARRAGRVLQLQTLHE